MRLASRPTGVASSFGKMVLAGREPRRRKEIAVGEVDFGQCAGRDGQRGDDRVGIAALEGGHQVLPVARLHITGHIEFEADRARDIDVEARQGAFVVEIVEWRIVAVGDEANDRAVQTSLGGGTVLGILFRGRGLGMNRARAQAARLGNTRRVRRHMHE